MPFIRQSDRGLPLGLTGATAATRYVGGTASGAPASGTFAVGDYSIDQTGKLFVCTVAGTPGTWTQVGAAAAALASAVVRITSGDITSSSASFVDLTGVTVTMTTGAHRVLVTFSALASATAGTVNMSFDLAIDGTRQGGAAGLTQGGSTAGGINANPGFSYLTDVLTAASHTFKIQWLPTASGGKVFASATAPAVLSAVELNA